MQMPKCMVQMYEAEAKFLSLAAEYGFNEEERKVIRDYMRHFAMTTIYSYEVVIEKKGKYLLNGLSIRNGTHLLDEVGLIIRNGEDPFEKMLEIMDDLDKEDNGGRIR